MIASVEIIIQDPDARDPGSASPPPHWTGDPATSSGIERVGPQAVLIVNQQPVAVEVTGRFASDRTPPGTATGSTPPMPRPADERRKVLTTSFEVDKRKVPLSWQALMI
jgi:hypothetical protein